MRQATSISAWLAAGTAETLSVVIPAHNEAETLDATVSMLTTGLERIKAFLRELMFQKVTRLTTRPSLFHALLVLIRLKWLIIRGLIPPEIDTLVSM